MLKTAQNVDRAMKTFSDVSDDNTVFFNVRENPFQIYGLYDPKTEPDFKRMPDNVALNVNEGVAALYLNTAGGRVRFSTDSPYITIKANMPTMAKMSHFSFTGSCGFDLYVDVDGSIAQFGGVFKPPFNSTNGFQSRIELGLKKLRYITINFPTYSNVKDLYIGIKKDSLLGEGLKYHIEKPVVYYGSSITQGGCASRAGNTYESIVSQRMNINHINLGFSGSGKGEKTMAEYISSLDMSAFVMDYDHNSPSVEHLAETHYDFYKTIRNANPTLPIVIMSKSDFAAGYSTNVERRAVIFDTYTKAVAEGDKKVYFIDGESVFRGPYENVCTVDGTHPNDMGFALMADAVEYTLKKAFASIEDNTVYML